MTKTALSLLLAVLTTIISFGQNCNCETNFEWVKKTFEDNDAGFRYALETKGQQAYADHNKLFLEKVRAAKTIGECTSLLYNWMTFFRAGHIGISLHQQTSQSADTSQKVVTTYPDWPTRNVNLQQFEQYLDKKTSQDLEGIWSSPPYKIGIQKEGNTYIGFIIESGAETWKKGQVKLKLVQDGSAFTGTFYLRDHSFETSADVELMGNNSLQIGRFNLERVDSKYKEDPEVLAYFKLLGAGKPYLEKLNETTLYLRIPSFRIEEKISIDSILSANREKILSTPNLIIDMRSGTGGSDASFAKILPIIYTNPIRTVGVEFFSTRLNNQRMLDFINKPEYGFDEDGKKWAKKSYDVLEANLGKFVNLDSDVVNIDKYDTVYPFPKNVGIIINKGNGSTDEQFLLAAKQSKKVKLFGATTFGELDISNMYFIESPCKEFTLGYCLTRSMRIPEMTIDSKGIQPDYYLDKSIPKYKWVDFVNKVLNEK